MDFLTCDVHSERFHVNLTWTWVLVCSMRPRGWVPHAFLRVTAVVSVHTTIYVLGMIQVRTNFGTTDTTTECNEYL